jgi:hypothetical protein
MVALFNELEGIWKEELGSQDGVVDISTGYGLDYRGVEVRVPVESRIFST